MITNIKSYHAEVMHFKLCPVLWLAEPGVSTPERLRYVSLLLRSQSGGTAFKYVMATATWLFRMLTLEKTSLNAEQKLRWSFYYRILHSSSQ